VRSPSPENDLGGVLLDRAGRRSVVIDEGEIERRKPVWSSLSDLWLDTELADDDLQRIAQVMKRSEYSIYELRDIYLFEVALVVFLNLLTVAGEWGGFDEDDNADDWLMIPLVDRLVEAGVHVKPGEYYSFLIPPIRDGDYTVENKVVLPITEHYGVYGSYHKQLRDVPDRSKAVIKVKKPPSSQPGSSNECQS
jgi:hypothetical protein